MVRREGDTPFTRFAQSLRSMPVRDFKTAASRKEMVSVPSHATTIEALIKIDEFKVSALPVVDMQGMLFFRSVTRQLSTKDR